MSSASRPPGCLCHHRCLGGGRGLLRDPHHYRRDWWRAARSASRTLAWFFLALGGIAHVEAATRILRQCFGTVAAVISVVFMLQMVATRSPNPTTTASVVYPEYEKVGLALPLTLTLTV